MTRKPRTAVPAPGADPVYDDFCDHGYARDDAAHPSAGLEKCPLCDVPKPAVPAPSDISEYEDRAVQGGLTPSGALGAGGRLDPPIPGPAVPAPGADPVYERLTITATRHKNEKWLLHIVYPDGSYETRRGVVDYGYAGALAERAVWKAEEMFAARGGAA